MRRRRLRRIRNRLKPFMWLALPAAALVLVVLGLGFGNL
jgi:hypothetical protein